MTRLRIIQFTALRYLLILATLLCGNVTSLAAEEIRVAVASNFRNTGRMLAEEFNARNSDQVVMIFGSSGKLYAQISKGAPFDVFLSADAERPQKLEAEGKAVSGTRMTFAIGKLTLWSSKPGLVDTQGTVLSEGNFSKLAMANPRHAPYGIAAREVLQKMQLMEVLQEKIVLGGNIEQTFQYVTSGNAELGFISRSQLAQSIWGSQGSRWEVPDLLYSPIDQQAILVHDKPAARAFLEFLKSTTARELIRTHGYDVP
jgi:molybdate transport system substrate-binding protein